jgi:dolichol-phosphate mannosyltransferase
VPETIIVVPTYNEKENISKLVPVLLDIGPDLALLVVDDNSPDGTAEYVEAVAAENPRVGLIRRPRKMGLGSAYITGFREALKRGARYIVQMDADFSHDPSYITELLKAMKDNDLALGSRYVKGVNVVNWPMHRLLLSYFANVYTRIVTRCYIGIQVLQEGGSGGHQA